MAAAVVGAAVVGAAVVGAFSRFLSPMQKAMLARIKTLDPEARAAAACRETTETERT